VFAAGANAILAKPFGTKDLRESVERVLSDQAGSQGA
jgi:DNA-binding response OmpR family regulator